MEPFGVEGTTSNFMQDSINSRLTSDRKPFIISLISNLSSERISQLFKIKETIYKFNIEQQRLTDGVKEYAGIVSS